MSLHGEASFFSVIQSQSLAALAAADKTWVQLHIDSLRYVRGSNLHYRWGHCLVKVNDSSEAERVKDFVGHMQAIAPCSCREASLWAGRSERGQHCTWLYRKCCTWGRLCEILEWSHRQSRWKSPLMFTAPRKQLNLYSSKGLVTVALFWLLNTAVWPHGIEKAFHMQAWHSCQTHLSSNPQSVFALGQSVRARVVEVCFLNSIVFVPFQISQRQWGEPYGIKGAAVPSALPLDFCYHLIQNLHEFVPWLACSHEDDREGTNLEFLPDILVSAWAGQCRQEAIQHQLEAISDRQSHRRLSWLSAEVSGSGSSNQVCCPCQSTFASCHPFISCINAFSRHVGNLLFSHTSPFAFSRYTSSYQVCFAHLKFFHSQHHSLLIMQSQYREFAWWQLHAGLELKQQLAKRQQIGVNLQSVQACKQLCMSAKIMVW